MRTTPALLALSLALAAAPAVLSAHPSSPAGDDTPPAAERGKDDAKHHRGPKDETRPREPKGTNHLLHACVTADATADGVDLRVLRGNRHMRDVLDGATTFRAEMSGDTKVRLVGEARFRTEDGRDHRGPHLGTFADLDAGDRVTLKFRAPRGGDAAALPAATLVVDHGPTVRCEMPPETPPADDSPGGEPTPDL
jgi:hypothetical protein